MCGIAGIALNRPGQQPDPILLARMCASLQHRGPDDSGGFLDAGIGMVMRRLAVIDVQHGQQPIFNEDQTIAVVFNGEIYNYHELQGPLVEKGHRFTTASDTETIVHLYEEYGYDFVQHLHGMFAVAIWDGRKQELILARDRLGVKPLYYFSDPDRLCFGSEIKAILQDNLVPRRIDAAAIHQLLTLGHVLPPLTCFQDIRELPPASLLVYKQGNAEIRSYWDLEFSSPSTFEEEHVGKDLLGQIKIATARRMISEVPLGAFLSGGIDSGIVVALMSQFLNEPVKTFSIGFEDAAFSELPNAKLVAERYKTDHHELIVKPNVTEIMDDLITHHDAPFYDSSAIPMYYLCKFAREHVTVALSGDGGDEMFAGYNIYLANAVANQYRRIPQVFSKLLIEPLASLVPESGKYINKGRVVREFFQGAYLEPLARYTRWATKVKRETRERLYYADPLRKQLTMPDEALLAPYFSPSGSPTELSRLLHIGSKTELPSDMLVKVDRMSMAHSLEVRSPFLDYALFEFAARQHDAAKLNKRTSKYMLRQVAKDLLPQEILKAPKRGFSIPLDRWLRHELRGYVEGILFDSQTEQRGWFDNIVVRELAAQHAVGRISRGRELWTLLTIELWQRAYIDRFTHFVENPPPLQLVTPQSASRGS